MKTIRCILCLIGLAMLIPSVAQANSPFAGPAYGGGSYGGVGNFFNPYSFPSSSSVHAPPYFAVHPPVYYSARHARPYGMSPFAAPPMVAPAAHYQGRLASEFVRPVVSENEFCEMPGVCGEVTSAREPILASAPPQGSVRHNPYAAEATQLATNR